MKREGRRNRGKGDSDVRRSGRLWKNRMAALLVSLLAVLAYTGCGSGDSGYSLSTDSMGSVKNSAQMDSAYLAGEAGGGTYEEAAEAEYDYDMADTGLEENPAGDTGVLEGRKLIQTVRLEVETKEFEQMMSTLETQVQDLGGYIESMETYNGSNYSDYVTSRYADLTVRIPSGKLGVFLETVSDISNVVRRYDEIDDVTLSYVDMESRRNALRTEQERLLEFMGQAETMEDIIALEERLSEVRYQLESMESQLRTIDNLIDYSTVHINVSEVKELTAVLEEEPSAWERIGDGFLESLKDIGEGVREAAIWFLTNIPYLVIWAAVIAAGILAGKRLRKNRIRKKEARRQEEQARIREQQMRMQEWESGKQNLEAPEPEKESESV